MPLILKVMDSVASSFLYGRCHSYLILFDEFADSVHSSLYVLDGAYI